MTDGLEISEISLQRIKQTTYDFRIESEYYAKKYLQIDNVLDKNITRTLRDGLATIVTDGTHYTPEYVQDGVPFLSALNVKKGYLDLDAGYKYITPQQHKALSARALPRKGDVLLRKVGVGARLACVVPDLPYAFSIFVSIALLRTKIDPYYLSTFINSKYGQAQLMRFNKGISQPDLHLEDIVRLKVPLFSDAFFESVRSIVLCAQEYLHDAKQKFATAENNLLRALPVEQSDTPCVSVKTFSESFMWSGRLDAEYYQPKYEQYEKAVTQCKNGYALIKNKFACIIDKCERNLSRYKYIEIGDINVGNGSYTYTVLNTEDLPDNAKIMTRVGDILVSTVRPNRGAVAILEEDNLLVSGAFTVLRPKSDYSKEILQVLLRTPIYRDWLLKFNVGTSYPVIKDDDVLNMPIPLLEESVQKEISDKVQQSFRLRKEAKRLLDNAIKAVETAIETDEETALSLLVF